MAAEVEARLAALEGEVARLLADRDYIAEEALRVTNEVREEARATEQRVRDLCAGAGATVDVGDVLDALDGNVVSSSASDFSTEAIARRIGRDHRGPLSNA